MRGSHHHYYRNRGLILSMAGLALVVAFTRCTPLNASIDKAALLSRSGSNTPTSALGGLTSPGTPIISAPSPIPVQVLLFKTRVMDGDAFEDLKTRLKKKDSKALLTNTAFEKKKMLELTDTQIDEIRQSRSTVVTLGEIIPSEAILYVKVALPRGSFDANDLTAFDMSIQPLSEGKWTLSVPQSSDNDREKINELVLSSLEGAIVVTKIELMKVRPEASPSPSPSASPLVRAATEDPLLGLR